MALVEGGAAGHDDQLMMEMGLRDSTWKSVRPGKVPWDEAFVADVARAMLRAIPPKAKQIVLAGDFGGADLVQVNSDLHRPSFKEIAANYVFLHPLVAKFPDHVPGGVLLTDIWLYLNRLLDNKFLCKPGTTPLAQAGVEASRCKRLIGALRYLYRNSVSSHHPRVSELKSMLQPSPVARARRISAIQRAHRLEEDEMDEALAAIGDGSPDDGAAEDGSDEEEAEEEDPVEDAEHPVEDAEHPVEDAEHPVEDAASDGEKSDTSGMATTLVLGADDLAKMSDVETDPINEVPDLSPMSDDDSHGKVDQDPLTDTDNESRSPWEKTGYKDKKGRILALVARNPKNGNGASSSNGTASEGVTALCEDFLMVESFVKVKDVCIVKRSFKRLPLLQSARDTLWILRALRRPRGRLRRLMSSPSWIPICTLQRRR